MEVGDRVAADPPHAVGEFLNRIFEIADSYAGLEIGAVGDRPSERRKPLPAENGNLIMSNPRFSGGQTAPNIGSKMDSRGRH